jgi:hypothetical protein
MAENEKPVEVWPIHESIVHALENRALELGTCFWIICHTVIPARHDRIIVLLEHLGADRAYWPNEQKDAIAHVIEQKRLADEKTKQERVARAEDLRVLNQAIISMGKIG